MPLYTSTFNIYSMNTIEQNVKENKSEHLLLSLNSQIKLFCKTCAFRYIKIPARLVFHGTWTVPCYLADQCWQTFPRADH